ncbi:transcription antitermination factor NusB [Limosilactobacillus secaliphilus]|uniref:Transcription antitermination protein NusB n=1 Tax=Limosilactobacillus secaliphilus TaxID=396268 RepID=A0A0R2I1M9_9LACO|nr:transcription antitermination factor NusB [Limosilactobacillus secaliphilus]KRN59119.1 transcription antitermination factor NusB [Limosilactobacillus secaliphilus]
MSFSRHTIRIAAFQTLFALVATPDEDRDQLYRQLLKLGPNEDVPAYLEELVDGVLDHQDEIDQTIAHYLSTGWTIDRLERPNLVILRLALYELQYEKLPVAVAINEALQLAKSFSDDKSRRFINGVLGHYEQEHANK